jgi:hypothetical protein
VRLRAVSLAPRRIRRGRPARLGFLLDAPATVRVGVYRVRGRSLRRVATLVIDGSAGRNALAFNGRREIAALPPGHYRAVLVASVPGGRPSAPSRLGFRLVGR